MTVAEIKEYIKKQVEKYDEIPDEFQDAKFKQATADLVIVLGMLDELPRDYAQETIDDMGKVLDNAWKKILGE